MEYRLIGISPEALNILQRYNWPGNIRELENIIQRAVIMCDRSIEVKDLPQNLKFQIDFPNADYLSLREMEKEYVKRVLASVGGKPRRPQFFK